MTDSGILQTKPTIVHKRPNDGTKLETSKASIVKISLLANEKNFLNSCEERLRTISSSKLKAKGNTLRAILENAMYDEMLRKKSVKAPLRMV